MSRSARAGWSSRPPAPRWRVSAWTRSWQRVKRMIPITQMIQTADTLKYLYMGGRIGKAQHMVGSLLHIKPLIGMKDGVIVALGKAHSRLQAYTAMSDMVAEAVGKGKAKVAYVHAGARQEVEKIRELVEAKTDVVESFFAELSPALAVHTGPGTAGLCFYPHFELIRRVDLDT